MLKKGLATVIILLFIGLAFSPSINANMSKSSLDPVPDIEVLEEDNATPIALVFQLIAKLRNHKEIQKLVEDTKTGVDLKGEISSIIEEDKELNTIVEELKSLDCGCEDDKTIPWRFPVLCWLLFPLAMLAFGLGAKFGFTYLLPIMGSIGSVLNCFWCI